ncbi:NCS1 family nucleobase:cation symporter-1 [Bacillus thermophilus]|uniref:NCS1 family nucleobase:cation symporter-1 n=1 Tax=Siminovitchia thermophila TaxID=1245522 RepID=A0ABS2R2U2_9BACI|nr:cytosine permease [Siminovitchia thermophila]MBM7713952.1 NCS1 family nucleobase:cation symporter-1 [Siminovitchia thermophila]ONK23835.1 hypothetical protein BLX87_08240 [Bacillus sp. VT-16-64]
MNKNDSAFGLLPVLPKERVWNGFDFSMVNIGLAIATWGFLIGGTLSEFVDLKMGIAASLAGNTLAVMIMALVTTLPSTKYGIDQYVSFRSVFGIQGVKLTLAVMVLIEFGWCAVLAIMFGRASSNILGEVTNISSTSVMPIIIFAFIAIVISWLIVAKGPVSIKWLNRIVAPGLVLILLIMLGILLSKYSVAEIFSFKPSNPAPDRWWNYMIAFELNLAAGLSWWPIMGGLSRLCKTQRAGFWPNLIGLNFFAVFGQIVGLMAGLALGTSDPTEWMIPLGGAVLGMIVLIFIAFANITSITSLVFSTSMALKQIKWVEKMEWSKLTFYFLLLTVPLIFFPDEVYSRFNTFLAVCGTFFGPLSGIYFVDYFILRKRQLDIRNLYFTDSGKPYYYWGGFNWSAIAAFVISTAAYFIMLDPITFEHSTAFLYSSASIPATIFGGILHYIFTKMIVIPKQLGGYVKRQEET